MGVSVFVSDPAGVPPELHSIFVVDEQQRIAWEATTVGNRIRDINFTVAEHVIREFRRRFDQLINLEGTRQVKPEDVA